LAYFGISLSSPGHSYEHFCIQRLKEGFFLIFRNAFVILLNVYHTCGTYIVSVVRFMADTLLVCTRSLNYLLTWLNYPLLSKQVGCCCCSCGKVTWHVTSSYTVLW